MNLIYHNSLTFNGENSEFTAKARILVNTVLETLIPFEQHCLSLEANIREAQKRAREQAELDSMSKSGDLEAGSSAASPSGGDLLEDLQYSSEEEDDDDWDEVEDR